MMQRLKEVLLFLFLLLMAVGVVANLIDLFRFLWKVGRGWG